MIKARVVEWRWGREECYTGKGEHTFIHCISPSSAVNSVYIVIVMKF